MKMAGLVPLPPERHVEADKCSVCQEPHVEPRALPCCHTFCTECLRELLDNVLFEDRLACPNCRAETVPPANVEDFPLDYAAQKEDVYRSFCPEEETEAPCKSCEQPGTANAEPSAYCDECGGGICESCVESHSRMKKHFKDHELVDWKKVSVDTFKSKRRQRNYRIHDGLEIQLFCEECNRFGCSLCLKERHKNHLDSAKPLAEVSEKRRAEVGHMLEAAEKKLVICEKHLEGLDKIRMGMTDYPNSLQQSITAAFDEYMRTLRAWCDQQLAEASDRCSQIAKQVSAQQIDTVNAMAKLSTGIQFGKKAMSCTRSDEIIEMSGTATEQLKGAVGYTVPPISRPLVFEKGNLQLGRLRDIEENDIRVKVPEYPLMNLVNDIGIQFILPINTRPVVKVLYGSQKQRSITVSPDPDTTAVDACTVKFSPLCAGKHTIEVWVGGVMCRRCDDVMFVRGVPQQAAKVRPGPDWDDKQFEKSVKSGTVLKVDQLQQAHAMDEEEGSFEVHVQWDNEQVVCYQWGNSEEYQLELDM